MEMTIDIQQLYNAVTDLDCVQCSHSRLEIVDLPDGEHEANYICEISDISQCPIVKCQVERLSPE